MGDRERHWQRELPKKIERETPERGFLGTQWGAWGIWACLIDTGWNCQEDNPVKPSCICSGSWGSPRRLAGVPLHRTKLRGFYYIVHRIQEHNVFQSALCCYSYNVHTHITRDSIVRHHLQTLFKTLLTYQTFSMFPYIQVNAHILLSGSIISSKPKRHIYQTQTPGSRQTWKPRGKKGYYEFVILEKHRDMLCYSRHFPSSKGHGQCPKSSIASLIPYDNLSDGQDDG